MACGMSRLLSHKDAAIIRWFIYSICIIIYSTEYYLIGNIVLLSGMMLSSIEINISHRELFITNNKIYAFITFSYYMLCAYLILSNPDYYFNLSFSIMLLVFYIPMAPDLILIEIDAYRGKL